jgi:thymidine kinase
MLELVVTGPVCSGKTGKLLEAAKTLNKFCDYFQLAAESRDKGMLCTRDGNTFFGSIVKSLHQIESTEEIILVDEIQWAHKKAIEPFLKKFKDRIIFAAGLDFDFQRKRCTSTDIFCKHAKTVEQIRTKCHYCSREAKFSQKIKDREIYVPCCTMCLMAEFGIKP